MKELVLPYVSFKFIDPIVYCTCNEGIELGFPEIRELIACIETISNQNHYLILVDVRCINNITAEGRRMLKNYTHLPFCDGTALLVDESKYECAQNLVNTYSTKYPFRAFNSETEAMEWLNTFSNRTAMK